MYSELPSFVFGFHGCDLTTKEAVLCRKEPLIPSNNDYDWLGSGIYFWEQNAQRAMDFAKMAHDAWLEGRKVTSRPIETPAVIGAAINLGVCMNLMDAEHIHRLQLGYNLLCDNARRTGKSIPTNTGGKDKYFRRLDRAVIETLCDYMIEHRNSSYRPYDTVRGLFLEGDAIYPGAGFLAETHIQICVRNPRCIKAYFDPLVDLL
ncbi:hypothetical protein AGMMS49992_22000 [Clostridia bacterium]|nr:hypothetical protein AGMMS49992_22000 [Clostridia bacterium]